MPNLPVQPGAPVKLSRTHLRRLRETHRSAGWPVQDLIEVELLAAGLLERLPAAQGCETLRLTDAGIACLADSAQAHRQALSAHETLVHRIAESLLRDGRIVWTQLSVRAQLPPAPEPAETETSSPRWKVCKPDVFSIRNTTVVGYLAPTVYEVKVSRADLLGDLKNPDKRDSYLGVGGQCWYVLGCNRQGQPIAEPDEIPQSCGVLVAQPDRLVVARSAPQRPVKDLPFALWMALAKSAPLPSITCFSDEASQAPLAQVSPVPDSGGSHR